MSSKSITIDIETYKLIESFRNGFDETENDIIKRILNTYSTLSSISEQQSIGNNNQTIPNDTMNGLFWKGILLPNGLQLRKVSKNIIYTAIIKNNRIYCNDREFFSPSAAATYTFGTTVNGWLFWEYFDEDEMTWNLLDNLRNKK